MYARYIKYLDVEIRPKIIELEAEGFRVPTWYPSQGGHPEEHDRAQEEFVRPGPSLLLIFLDSRGG